MQDIPLFPQLEQFLGYFQAIKERSPLTIREYRYDLVLFFRFMQLHRGQAKKGTTLQEIDISSIDEAYLRAVRLTDFYAYLTWLSRERRCGPATRARKTASLRAFFHYLKNKAFVLEENPALELESPKQLRQLPRHLSLEESRQLLETAADTDDPRSSRDVCILTFFLNCGLRLAELCSIDLSDIRGDTLVVMGKGGKERTIYLNGACLDALDDWLAERPQAGLADPDALFVSRLRQRISPKTVQYLLKKYLLSAGLDPRRYSVHKLRHTAATLMYQYGRVDIRALQQILGHASIATTEIYTHVDNAALHDAVDANPLNQVRPGRRRRADSRT
ncbi:MAG: tyrosine recombinase XerC [Ruminococcaceae bacterium]|nr:tyrosine recombinase XerC [Oscillospiraceae bacterium]